MSTFLKWFKAIDLNIFSALFLIAFTVQLLKNYDRKNMTFKYLLNATTFVIIQLFAEVFVEALVKYDICCKDKIIFIINSYLYFSSDIISIYLILLVSKVVNSARDVTNLKKILAIPLIGSMILVCINFFNRILFEIPKDGVPVFKKYYQVGFVFAAIYIIIGLSLIIKNRKVISNTEKAIFCSFFIMPILGIGIQILVPNTFLMWSFIATAIVMVFIFLQKRITQQDYLTKLWTRSTFDIYLENKLDLEKNKNTKNDTIMIYLDLDEFKEINDIYGHNKGDKALKTFANALKESINEKAKIVRYGGDEFIVLYYNIPNIDIEEEIKKLKKKVDEKNNINKVKKEKWKVKFSYAYAKYDPKIYGSSGQFIRYLDEKMYEQKASKKLNERKNR